jgi:ribosomal-protein-alanine N-acetyltransferase
MASPKLQRKTRRLVVRPLRGSDYGAWVEAWSKLSPPKNAWDRKPAAPEKLNRKHFAKILREEAKLRQADRSFPLRAFLKDGTMVGDVHLLDITRGVFHNAYIGYFMFNRHWRQGYGKEAVRAALDIAFRDLKLHRVEAGVSPHNRRSQALARAVGLRREGFSPKRIFLGGKWIDLVLYAATSEHFGVKWKEAKGRVQP